VDIAMWSSESPYDDVVAIKGHLALCAQRGDTIEEHVPHGPPASKRGA